MPCPSQSAANDFRQENSRRPTGSSGVNYAIIKIPAANEKTGMEHGGIDDGNLPLGEAGDELR